ncbi:MAG: histidine phosphatase family protein [Phycisphaerales bacterium]|nr:histidine phosphatase family protein [Phycisphaerales bacterium]
MSARTLIILRHGKAAPHDAYPTDHARPLVARGHAEAEFIGVHLATHGPRPSVVISSPVLRAHTTAQVVARHLGVPLRTDACLSTDAGVRPIISMLTAEPPEENVLIAGHNPTLSELLAELLRNDQPGRGDLHTGEAAILRFTGPIAPGTATMVDRVRLTAEQH